MNPGRLSWLSSLSSAAKPGSRAQKSQDQILRITLWFVIIIWLPKLEGSASFWASLHWSSFDTKALLLHGNGSPVPGSGPLIEDQTPRCSQWPGVHSVHDPTSGPSQQCQKPLAFGATNMRLTMSPHETRWQSYIIATRNLLGHVSSCAQPIHVQPDRQQAAAQLLFGGEARQEELTCIEAHNDAEHGMYGANRHGFQNV